MYEFPRISVAGESGAPSSFPYRWAFGSLGGGLKDILLGLI